MTSPNKMDYVPRTVNGRKCDLRTNASAAEVSVVVPIYNAGETLEWALASLVAQDFGGILEIICVDDASSDDSRKIIDSYAANNPNISVVVHHENAGYGASMNDGIAVARGIWIGILEPDDYILPDMISTLMEYARFEDCDIVKSPYIREIRYEGVARGGIPKYHLQCNYKHRIHPATSVFDAHDPGAEHLLRHHPSVWSAIYRKAFLEENHIMFPEYPGAGWADGEFGYRTLLIGRIRYIDEPFYVYREETPDESTAFQHSNKLLPLNRWLKMQDIIEGLNIDDAHVLRAHNAKGFAYAKEQIVAHENDGEVEAAVHEIFDRMDPTLVCSDAALDPEIKELYGAYRGVNVSNGRVLYLLNLAKELAGYVRANGLNDTFDRIRLLAKK